MSCSSAVVLADARFSAILAPVQLAVVLADARPAALLAPTSLAVVLADARPAAIRALHRLFRGCVRRCLTRRYPCNCFFHGCARRCSIRRITYTGFFDGCARRCSPRRMACTCSFRGCTGHTFLFSLCDLCRCLILVGPRVLAVANAPPRRSLRNGLADVYIFRQLRAQHALVLYMLLPARMTS